MSAGRHRRGLEVRKETATPQVGDMTLYVKAGPPPPPMDGGNTGETTVSSSNSIGDCPFAQCVRMVLEEKNLPYEVRPTLPHEKPQWLLDPPYHGQMPALRHGRECYVESAVICDYLDYFFPTPSLSMVTPSAPAHSAIAAADASAARESSPPVISESTTTTTAGGGIVSESALPVGESKQTDALLELELHETTQAFFPAVAQFLKHTAKNNENDDAQEAALQHKVQVLLGRLNAHLLTVSSNDNSSSIRSGPFLAGNGARLTLLDCRITPQLYHLQVGLHAFKNKCIDLESQYPAVYAYLNTTMMRRESFRNTVVPEETVIWGWTNARNKQMLLQQ